MPPFAKLHMLNSDSLRSFCPESFFQYAEFLLRPIGLYPRNSSLCQKNQSLSFEMCSRLPSQWYYCPLYRIPEHASNQIRLSDSLDHQKQSDRIRGKWPGDPFSVNSGTDHGVHGVEYTQRQTVASRLDKQRWTSVALWTRARRCSQVLKHTADELGCLMTQ